MCTFWTRQVSSVVSVPFPSRPDEAMLFVMAKVCLFLKNILFCAIYKEFTS